MLFFLKWMIIKYCANKYAKSIYRVPELEAFYVKTTLQLVKGTRIRTEKQRSKSATKLYRISPIYVKEQAI